MSAGRQRSILIEQVPVAELERQPEGSTNADPLKEKESAAMMYLLGALERFDKLTADEIRARYPDIPRRVSGFNLTALLPENGFNVAQAIVGSESTCVLVLEATVRLIRNPKARSLVVLGYPSVFEAADHVPQIMNHRPIACEGMDDRLVRDIESVGYESDVLRLLPEGQGFLLVEFGGNSKEEADRRARGMLDELNTQPGAPSSRLFDDAGEEKRVWKVREAGLGATAHVERDRPT